MLQCLVIGLTVTNADTWLWRLTEEPRSGRVDRRVLGANEDRLRQRQRVADHGAVQPVLGHDAASAPAPLRFTPVGPSVLEPHLKTEENRGYACLLSERLCEYECHSSLAIVHFLCSSSVFKTSFLRRYLRSLP